MSLLKVQPRIAAPLDPGVERTVWKGHRTAGASLLEINRSRP